MTKEFFVRRKTYTLKWPEGAELAGLQVRAKATSIRSYLVLTAVVDGNPPDVYEDTEECDQGGTPTNYDFAHDENAGFRFIARKFSDALLEWNLTTDDGEPVKPIEAEVWNQDREFFLVVVRAWLDALASVSRPLEEPSPAGVPLAVASIPMEPLSESRAS